MGDEIAVLQSRVLAEKVIKRLGLLNDPEFNPSLGEPEESLFRFPQYLNPKPWIPASWKKVLKEAMGRETERCDPCRRSPAKRPGAEEQRRSSRFRPLRIFCWANCL